MKLVNNRYQQHMDFNLHSAYFLVVENSQEFLKVVEELYAECNSNKESQFVLSNNAKIISIPKNCLLINNFFDLDVNDRKITNEINNRILNYVSKQDFVQNFYDLNKLFIDINDKIIDNFEFKIEYDPELTYEKFVKISNYKIGSNLKFIDKLMAYIKTYCALKRTKLVIFVGLSLFLSQNELELFIKELNYLDLNCLFIEPILKYNIGNVGKIIIDEDLCEI